MDVKGEEGEEGEGGGGGGGGGGEEGESERRGGIVGWNWNIWAQNFSF
jgi:hypothetical protein